MVTNRISAGIYAEVRVVISFIGDGSTSWAPPQKKGFSHVVARCIFTGGGPYKRSRDNHSVREDEVLQILWSQNTETLKARTIIMNPAHKHTGNACMWTTTARLCMPFQTSF